MSDNILDIRKWKHHYPFSNNVLLMYNQFDQDVDGDVNRTQFYSLCNHIITQSNGNLSIHMDTCVKLLRNLGYFSVVQYIYELKPDRCNVLFNWIYRLINEGKITHDIINKTFELYDDEMREKNNFIKCYYDRDIKIKEPINLTLLNIFDNNTLNIIDALMGKDESIKSPCRKFVCECVKIYKQMNNAYCLNEQGKSGDYKEACEKLELFKRIYNIFLGNLGELSNRLPSLDYSDDEFSVKCPADGQNHVLKFERATQTDDTLTMGISEDDAPDGPKSPDDSPVYSERVDSPMKKTITTTIGTVAGASSLLAFLYKFSPGRNWIRSGFRGGRDRINSNLYAHGPSELLFDGMEHNDFNSYSIGYEAM